MFTSAIAGTRGDARARSVSALARTLLALALAASGCTSPQGPAPSSSADSSPVYAPPSLVDVKIDGFQRADAADLLEMCVDLDSQDDLANFVKQNGAADQRRSRYYPRISADWVEVYDSRTDSSDGDAARELDPTRNGFSPFHNAWTLWRKRAHDSGQRTYALAIRGTVVGDRATILEDVLATTIPARYGVRRGNGVLPYSFSDLPRAEVHGGFAYATVSVMLDRNFGVLRQLNVLESEGMFGPGTHLLITGHSQGAAMAALAQAFLHYAQLHHQFMPLLDGLNVTSYMFAQPKPGNHQFSEDFALYATLNGDAFVLNNSLDPITRVPLTIEVPTDAVADMEAQATLSIAIQDANRLSEKLAAFVSNHVDTRIASFVDESDELFIDDPSTRPVPATANVPAVSLDYVAAGRIIPLIGRGDEHSSDDFVEHHAITYRKLFDETFGVVQREASGVSAYGAASAVAK